MGIFESLRRFASFYNWTLWKPLAGTLVLLVIPRLSQAQANFESKASGAWGSATTWRIVSGSDSDTIPDANDNVSIKNGHTITAGSSIRDCANISVETGGTLSVTGANNVRVNANPGSVTVNGTLVLSSSGSLLENGTGTRSFTLGPGGKLTISGTAAFLAFDTYTCDPTSTVEFTAAANQNVQSGIAYGNLTLGGSGTKTVAPLPTDTTFTSNGKLTVGSGVSFDVSTNVLRAHFNGDVQIDGTLDVSVGIVVVEMRGALWTNNGIYLRSYTAGYGLQPTMTFYSTQIGGTTATQKLYDVCFEGNCTATTSIDSARNIEIKPGATFTGGTSCSYRLTGNWINNGTYNCSGSTVSLIGTTAQTVAGSTFSSVIVNNPAGVTLSGNVTIAGSGTLTLTSGNITTGSNVVNIQNPIPAALGLGSNVIIGNVTRAMASGSTSTYDFLSSNAFITPNGVGNPSTMSMSEFPGTFPANLAPTADTNKIVKRYYSLSQTGAGIGYSFVMRLPYLQTEARGNEAAYDFYHYNGLEWADMGSSVVDSANNYVQQVGLTDVGEWAIAEANTALPIQLARFTAALIQNTNNVHLAWTTVTETNNYGFYVQRSLSDQTNYVDLPNSFIAGHGTTIDPHEYSWDDNNVPQGTYYYRLRQIDFDGTNHLSEGIETVVSSVAGVSQATPLTFALSQNYPNPFNPSTTIQFSVEAREYTTLIVYNTLGQLVETLFSGIAVPEQQYNIRFDGTNLTNGIYFAKLVSGSKSALRKMILLK